MFGTITRHIALLLAAVAIAMLWSGATFAQATLERANQSIDIVASVGFQQRLQLDKWTPVTVTVRNAGDSVRGYLDIVVADSQDSVEYQTHYRQSLDLANGAQKRLHFTVYLTRITEPLRIRVVTDAGEVASHTVELHSKLSQQRFIAVLGKDVNLDYLNDRDTHRTQVVYPLPGFLPTHWRGYDGVEAIVVHRFALRTLTANQYLALRNWIYAGGTLVISGGYDTAILRTPRIAQLLPAQVVGTRQLQTGRALHRALGVSAYDDSTQTLTSTQPIGLIQVERKNQIPQPINNTSSTRVVHHIDDVPLVLDHAYGDGRVVLLTFDIASAPFATWSGMQSFMVRMANLSPVKTVTLQHQNTVERQRMSLLSRLARDRGMDYPNHATIIAFVGFYLAVVALSTRKSSNFATPQHRKTLLMFAVPVAFSVAATGLFHRVLFPQSQAMASVAVIEPINNSDAAHLQLKIRTHSTLTDSLEFQYTGANPVLRTSATPPNRRTASTDQRLAPWVFYQGVTRAAKPLHARPYTEFSVHGSDITDFAVTAAYRQGNTLDFHNRSGRDITSLWAITQSEVFNLGAIANGNSLSKALSAATGNPRGQSAWREQLRNLHRNGDAAVAAVTAILDGAFGNRLSQDTPGSVLLIGFTSNPWLMATSQRWQHTDLSIMVWRLHQSDLHPVDEQHQRGTEP